MPHPRSRSAAPRWARTLATAALLLAGCSDATAPGSAPTLAVTPGAIAIAWGDTLRLAVAGGTGSVVWTSSDTSVARVDATGLVTAIRGGVARIEARDGDRRGGTDVTVDTRLVDVSAGIEQSCGTTRTGRVLCWGTVYDSTPGAATPLAMRDAPDPVVGPIGAPVRGVQVGRSRAILGNHGTLACAQTATGPTLCWGMATQAQFGRGLAASFVVERPAPIGGAAPLAKLALGYDHACGLAADGTAYCWGTSSYALGHGQRDASCAGGRGRPCQTTPAPVTTTTRFQAIAVGNDHSCGVALDGQLLCWGTAIQAGDPRGQFWDRVTPAPVGTARYASVAAGFDHSCALTTDGAVHCWGSNGVGQLGRGPVDSASLPLPAPVTAPGGLRFREVSAGSLFSCAVAVDGRVLCWGSNAWGQLGDGSTTDRAAPSAVASTRRFVRVSAGTTHACAVAEDGATLCWGDNRRGQLGNGDTIPSSLPVRVGGPR
jgi:alpha-tubulin suppressor-like RCC1 family protein